MPHRSAPLAGAILVLATACSSGGGGGGGNTITGTVRSPGGQSIGFRAEPAGPQVAPHAAQGGRASVELPGTAPVPDGTPVQLVRLGTTGATEDVLLSTTTAGGRYSFDLDEVAMEEVPSLVNVALVAGSGATALRSIAFTDADEVDVDPASEALVQLVLGALQAPAGWFALTLEEEADLAAAFDLLVATEGVEAQPDLAATIALLAQTGEASPGFMNFLAAATSAPGNTLEGPGDIGDFFPSTVGDVWGLAGELVADGGAPVAYRKSRRITADDGNGALTLRDEDTLDGGSPEHFLVRETSTGFLLVQVGDPGNPLGDAVPFEIARFPLRAGDTWEQYDLRGLSLGEDLDGDQHDEVVDLRSETTCVGFEEVNAPAGTFEHCARFDTTAVTVLRFTSGPLVRSTVRSSDWFAPGIGPVRAQEDSVVSGAGVFEQEVREEALDSYQVGTTGRGILPPATLVEDVAPASSDQETPGRGALAFDGTNYLFVGCREGAVAHLVGQRIGPTGLVLGEVELYPLGLTCSFANPTVVFDGENYLVAFQSAGQVLALRVTPEGDVLDPLGIPVSTTGESNFQPAAAFDGENALVVWRKFDDVLSGEIWGALVTPGGSNLGEFLVRTGEGDQLAPAIVFGGENYLVAWSDDSGTTRETRAARVAPDEAVLDPASFDLGPGTSAEERPCASFDGERYLVAWTTQSGLLSNLRAARVKLDGTVIDDPPLLVQSAGSAVVAPTAVFDGTNHWLAWALDSRSAPFGIHAARIAPDGTLLDGTVLSDGLTIAEPPPEALLVRPVLVRGATSLFAVWIVNAEGDQQTKDVGATLIYPF